MRKIFFLGLDSAPPKIIYENYGVELNNIKEIVEESERYILRTCYPPITIPAWMVMFTGRSPGELGIYGFRHRKVGEVEGDYIVNSSQITYPTLWETLSKKGYNVGVIGVPPTYPPKPVKGFMISDFTTPGPEKNYTWPPWLKKEIEEIFGQYIFDITYRSEDKDGVARDIFNMINQHLELTKYLVRKKIWDLFIYVEIAVDRVHHAFWKYFDEDHPRYTQNERYEKVIPEFYKRLDNWMSEIKNIIPKDAIIIIASDHGIKPMKGAFVMNQWLQEQGYLKLKEKIEKTGVDLKPSMIDWGSTITWAWGGYYSRIFINLRNREPYGIVKEEEYEDIIKQLKTDLLKIKGPNGEEWNNIVHTPREIYDKVTGDPPDLMVYLDDLSWRPAGTIGWNSLYLPENDRGPDDAEHDWYGVFLIHDPEGTIEKGFKGEIRIENVYQKLLEITCF